MKRLRPPAWLLLSALGVLVAPGAQTRSLAEEPSSRHELNEHLQVFAPFLGKVWKAKVSTSKDGEPVYDVARWDKALQGQAIRMWHSVGNGSYGGETVVMWDRSQEKLVYTYFTTAGFFTNGTIEFVDERTFLSRETVTGNEAGITEVEATSHLLPDGRLRVGTRMLQKGEWVDRGETLYEVTPEAELILE